MRLFLCSYLAKIFFIFIALTTGLSAQSQTVDAKNEPKFTEKWNKVDSLERIGLYRQALNEVNLIFEQASASKHHNQVIKSVLYELKFNSYLEEDDYVLGIGRLESLTKSAPSPSKEILHSLLAEVYWGYYSANSWKFQDRTATDSIDLQDVRTWDLKRIAIQIRNHYALSLLNADVSKVSLLSDFSEIITSDEETQDIQPTLYDFLGHRALNFFKANIFSLQGPAETFVVDQEDYFSNNRKFLALNVSTTDSLNTRFLAMRVFRLLTQFHLSENNIQPLFSIELERIQTMREWSTLSNKDDIYYSSLERLTKGYSEKPYVSEAWHTIAQYHVEQGAVFTEETKEENKKAHEICVRTMSKYPKAYGSQLCASLKSYIESKSLEIHYDNTVLPNEESRFLIKYKNTNKAHYKVVSYDYEKYREDGMSDEELVKLLKKEKGVHSGVIDLVDLKDFNMNSMEINLPARTPGFYFLVVSTDGSYEHLSGGYTYVPFIVTDLTYQKRSNSDGTHSVLVSSRKTGFPISGAECTVTYEEYNNLLSKYVIKTVGTFKTDSDGLFSFKRLINNRYYNNYEVNIQYNEDQYIDGFGAYGDRKSTTRYTRTHFFTDRKLYRPGQTVYFKGIIVEARDKDRKLAKNQTTTVRFYDVNYQEQKTVTLKTNQFGSFEGEFKIPEGILPGQMQIKNQNGSTYFRVEEYKRPKFTVTTDPVEGEYKVNEEVTVSGSAMALAGNALDGATVKYRVVRSTTWDWRNFRYGWYYNNAPPKEIATGEVLTDENGVFKVSFDALPDLETDPKTLPVFSYTVTTDVTDLNGETHSSTGYVRVGYHSLALGHNVGGDLNQLDGQYLRVSTTNLNGQKINAQGEVTIEKLKTPDQVYFTRRWEVPRSRSLTMEEYHKKYPNEIYDNENNYENWEVEKEVYRKKFNTANTDSLGLNDYASWKPGVYHLTIHALDKNGIKVEKQHYFTLYNPEKKKCPTNDVFNVRLMKPSAEPGEEATLLISSAAKEMHVHYDLEANGEIYESNTILLSKEQRILTIPVREEHRGNITINFSTIKNNRPFTRTHVIYVPYTNKALDVEFATFRNKLLPGAKEEWSVTIKNKKGEAEQAEFLATLYDASLDELYTANSFYMSIYPTFYGQHAWGNMAGAQAISRSNRNYYWNSYVSAPSRYYPRLNYFGWSPNYYRNNYYRGRGSGSFYAYDSVAESDDYESEEEQAEVVTALGNISSNATRKEKKAAPVMEASNEGGLKDEALVTEEPGGSSGGDNADLSNISARANFNETAFFYPQLLTNKDGEVTIRFTMPESLTKWRFLGLAHTEDLKIGTLQGEIITQKELMVTPNMPRFFREGDGITISAKIANISEENLEGNAQLILYDPFTEEKLDARFQLTQSTRSFTADAGRSTAVSWELKVPYELGAVKYKVVAQAGTFSDGEENVLPILSNRKLVTESLPLPIRGEQKKKFEFKKLKNSKLSTTLKHHSFTLEFTSNPAWYAIQAMPYMMEYPHECAEQTFTRYYSNAIATHIMNSNPKVRTIIEKWGEESPEAFLSNLSKNQELKAVMLEETPWVLQAKSEEEQKKNLSVLLDLNRMSNELDKALNKTIRTQGGNGGWPWFPGMKENRFITQHIITGMGHLDHLGIKDVREDNRVWKMIKKGVDFLDKEIVEDFENAKRWDSDYLENQHIGYTQIQYLYARSYFMQIGMNGATKEAVNYYKDQATKFWLQFNLYGQGMIALGADRLEMTELSARVYNSLKDRAIYDEEMGMYWKDYRAGYYWYQAPIETQALMIEVFDEVGEDAEAVEELKLWLLKQKQTTHWKTTKQTTEAVYALLLKGTDLLASDEMVNITIGGKPIQYVETTSDDPYEVKAQAGTGYIKTKWNGDEVNSEMGDITVEKKDPGAAWGAVYWQYFEDLDKITYAETNLKLKKDVYLLSITPDGEQLTLITAENPLKVGEKVRIRIELRTDRNLEYVHMKDMRAAGLEPLSVLSRYRYQDGLGYYQATKDAATHFFFDYIPKGTYVFEYDLRVQHKGDFSNGTASIQCMYAPEFTSHSDGIRIRVE